MSDSFQKIDCFDDSSTSFVDVRTTNSCVRRTKQQNIKLRNAPSYSGKKLHFTLFFNLMTLLIFLRSASCLEEIVCGGFDMRNSPSHFLSSNEQSNIDRFNVCTVIEGDVRLILMTDENLTVEDFEPVRFPLVREITGSLMVFQLTSLRSLEYLFPELRVIRGGNLVHNYALVLFQNPHLKEVGLPKLVEISRGGVRIVDNAELCYANTLNWTEINRDRYTPPYIENNQSPNSCADRCVVPTSTEDQCTKRLTRPNELNSSVTACWNYETCQPTCPKFCRDYNLACNYSIPGICCHHECIGGCVGPTNSDCYACRSVRFKNECISSCPKDYYKVLNRRCITKEECISRKSVTDENNEEVVYKALDFTGTCELKCPENYDENPDNKKECIKCPVDVGCTKKCIGTHIQSLSDAENIKGCNIMNGALDITMHSGLSKNVVEKLEEYLGSLREVREYVKISFTPSLVSLSMLKNLRMIRGEKLWNDKYAVSVFENVNLAQLWNFTREKDKLQILHGTLQFHNNPQLCIQTIGELATAVNLKNNITEHDVSPNSNGNKAVCEELEISLKFVYISADSVVLNWEEFNTSMMDHRMFLGYQLYYKVVETENVNIFENRDACSDSWHMVFYDTEERGALLTTLKPYTLYAFYVRTLMVNSPGAKGGISKVVFARTKFDPPSAVIWTKVESLTYDSIYLEYEPPMFPNGEVTHYMISYVAKPDILPKERNYCNEGINYKSVSVDKPVGDEEHSVVAVGGHFSGHSSSSSASNPFNIGVGSRLSSADSETCSKFKCCECGVVQGNGTSKLPTDDSVYERAAFENTIHNIIFVSNRKKGPEAAVELRSHTHTRKKRAIEEFDSPKMAVKPRTNISLFDLDFNSTSDLFGSEPVSLTPIVKNHTGLNFTIKNLKHFTSYEIKIWACQNDTVKDRDNYCSRQEVMRLKRTLQIESKDAINETSIKVVNFTAGNHQNDQRFVTWAPPEDPNGAIVGYDVEYSRDRENKKTGKDCVNISQYRLIRGYLVTELMPGNYSFRVRALSLAQRGPWTHYVYFVIPEPYKLSDTVVVLVAIACSAVAIGFGIFMVIYFYRRQFRKKLPEYLMNVFSANPEYISQLEVYKADEWELKRDDVELIREIGRGTFGTVYEGRGTNIVSVCKVRFGECAIKTVGEKATIYDRWHFLIEASVMKQFNTAYIVKLLGVVSEGQPALVVMELMYRGNLKEYLVSRRPESEDNIHGLSPPTLREALQMAGEIADGMAYLEAMKFCHRDLAARNCMVAGDGTCKIGDFGMARDVYVKDYYRPLGRRLMPVRWMAPEALKDATFTSKSDVWSYGVVMWEIATLASQPYPGLSTEDVFGFVVDSRRTMEMPGGCPQRLFDLMSLCWKYDAKERVSFADLTAILLPDLNETFRRISYYCTQRGQQNLTHRAVTAPTKVSPTAVTSTLLNECEPEDPVVVSTIDCVDPTVPFSLDEDFSQTPINDGPLTDSDAELTEPVCNNNRRNGLPKSFSSPNWNINNNINNNNNRRSPVEPPLTPTMTMPLTPTLSMTPTLMDNNRRPNNSSMSNGQVTFA